MLLHAPRAVLDSIAAPMRGDESYSALEDSASRAALLIKLASLLKTHASRFASFFCSRSNVHRPRDSRMHQEDEEKKSFNRRSCSVAAAACH